MGFLRDLLSRIGLADRLSDSERRGHLSAIEEYIRLLAPDRGGSTRLLDGFYRRYDAACSRKEEKAFLETERLELESRLRSKAPQKAAPVASHAVEGGGSVMGAIYASYAKRLERHARVALGDGASAEVEHLYGCLLQFEKRYLPLLAKSVAALSDRELARQVQELGSLFHPLTAKGSRLPVVFDQYLQRVARCRNADDAEKEGQAVLREAWQAWRRVKRVAQLARDHRSAPKEQITLQAGQKVTAEAAALAVLEEIAQIFHDFRLKGLE